MEKPEIQIKLQPSVIPGSAGFTLIEIMVAMTILTVALLGLTSVTAIVVQSNYLSRTITEATTLANDRMEQLKNIPSPSGSDSIISNLTRYTRVWTVTPDSPAANLTSLEVRVNWNWRGTARNVTIRNITAR